MILDLDIGNTRSKWRVSDASGEPVADGVAGDVAELLAETAETFPLQRVRASCVRGGEVFTQLVEQLRQRWQLQVETARVVRHCQGVSVSYAAPSRLGVDRWLAMLAAYRAAAGETVVADCGTALTVDLLDAGGRHRGGYIVPGLNLAARALTENTGIRLAGEPQWSLEPGNSTEDAVYHGVLLNAVALLEKLIGEITRHGSGERPLPVYLTGGDAGLLARYLTASDAQIHIEPGLVLDGLALALPECPA